MRLPHTRDLSGVDVAIVGAGFSGLGMAVEHESWRRVIETADRAEGIAAFNEKRDPNWQNR